MVARGVRTVDRAERLRPLAFAGLYLLPVLVALTVGMVFTRNLGLVLLGVLAWASATGVLDSTVKALVADMAPGRRLATKYGVFAAVHGGAALAGASVAGGLYEHHVSARPWAGRCSGARHGLADAGLHRAV